MNKLIFKIAIPVLTIIAIIGGVFLIPHEISINGSGILSIALAQEDSGTVAYQVIVPNGEGSETGLQVFPPKLQIEGKDNWLAVQSQLFGISIGSPIFDKENDITNYDLNSGNSYIDSISNELVIMSGILSDKCKYDIEIADYTIYNNDTVFDDTKNKELAIEPRAKFRSYVYGSGSDVYEFEDTPQKYDNRNLPVNSVTIYAEVNSIAGKEKATASTKLVINSKKYNGGAIAVGSEITTISTTYNLNPNTNDNWSWDSIDQLQAGITLKDAECQFVYILVETEVHSQTFFPITPTEVTPGTPDSWEDVDVSSYIAAGATGVILHVNQNTSGNYTFGVRKNGSTDARIDVMRYYYHSWCVMGVDENRVFECYVDDENNIDVYVVGYTMSGVTMFTNAYDKSIGTTDTWTDVDCSIECPSATALIFEPWVVWSYEFGLRKNGSSDARVNTMQERSSIGAIIGCDESQICENWINNTSADLYLTGYATDGVVMNTNANDRSLGSTGSWIDLTALPSGAVMGFYEQVNNSYYRKWGFRENGSAENIVQGSNHAWAIVDCDDSELVEGQINDTDSDFYEIGYAEGASATPDISNTPSTWAIGTVATNTDYWADVGEPSWPLTDGDCHFAVTNSSGAAVDIDIKATNFTGGVGWAISGSAGENQVVLKAGVSGAANEGAFTTLTTSDQSLITSLADSDTEYWELMMESATSHTDGAEKTSTVTLTASLS